MAIPERRISYNGLNIDPDKTFSERSESEEYTESRMQPGWFLYDLLPDNNCDNHASL